MTHVKNQGPGRPPGATKGDGQDAVIKLRIHKSKKGEWVRKARSHGQKLSAWIRERCDAAE